MDKSKAERTKFDKKQPKKTKPVKLYKGTSIFAPSLTDSDKDDDER